MIRGTIRNVIGLVGVAKRGESGVISLRIAVRCSARLEADKTVAT